MNIATTITDYLRSSKAELEKVTWPSRRATLRYSGLVLGVSVVIAVFFASLDFGLSNLVTAALRSRNAGATSAPANATAAPTPAPAVTTQPAAVPGIDIKGASPNLIPVGDVTTQAPPDTKK